jgi:hypothetical protein
MQSGCPTAAANQRVSPTCPRGQHGMPDGPTGIVDPVVHGPPRGGLAAPPPLPTRFLLRRNFLLLSEARGRRAVPASPGRGMSCCVRFALDAPATRVHGKSGLKTPPADCPTLRPGRRWQVWGWGHAVSGAIGRFACTASRPSLRQSHQPPQPPIAVMPHSRQGAGAEQHNRQRNLGWRQGRAGWRHARAGHIQVCDGNSPHHARGEERGPL